MNGWRKSGGLTLLVAGFAAAVLVLLAQRWGAGEALTELREPSQSRVSSEGEHGPGFDRYLPGIFK